MDDDHGALIADAQAAAEAADDGEALRQARAKFLGKKGAVTQKLKGLGQLDPHARKAAGQALNKLRGEIEAIFDARREALDTAALQAKLAAERIDPTLPGRSPAPGTHHPIETTMRIIVNALVGMGFRVADGPEIEDAHHNFDALNFPPDHPAKEMQDTFFLAAPHTDAHGAPLLLRTHTSPVQIRAMETQSPPLRVVAPGKVYRCDADVTHSPMFHQVEGFWVDDRVTFRDLKGVLTTLLRAVFGPDVPVRFRPSFFPYTEPRAEGDMGCVPCRGRGCRICGHSGWLEVLGSGMIHPNVLAACKIDPQRWQGFAFGLGVERFAMIRYQIPDIRLFYESDQRFLDQLRDPLPA